MHTRHLSIVPLLLICCFGGVHLPLVAQSQQETARAAAYFAEADAFLRTKELVASLGAYEHALEIYQRIYTNVPHLLSQRYAVVGENMRAHGHSALSVQYYTKAAEAIARAEVNDTTLLQKAQLCRTLAQLYHAQQLNHIAIHFFQESLEAYAALSPQASLPQQELLTLLYAGKLTYQQQQYTLAVAHYTRALDLLGQQASPAKHIDLALVHKNLANCYLHLGKTDSSLWHFHTVCTLTENVFGSHAKEVAACHQDLVDAYFTAGDYEATWKHAQHVVHIYQKLGAHAESDLIAFYRNHAQNHIHIRAYHTASHWYERYFAAKYDPYVPKPITHVDEFVEIADLFLKYSTPTHALLFLTEGLAYYEQLPQHDTKIAANLSYRIASLYADMSFGEKAYPYYKKALAFYRANDAEKAAKCLLNLSAFYKTQAYALAQLSSLEDALELLKFHKQTHSALYTKVLEELTVGYYTHKQHDFALRHAKSLLTTYEKQQAVEDCKRVYILLANIYNAKHDTHSAFSFYNKVLISSPDWLESHINTLTLEANQNLSLLFGSVGEHEKALKHANNAQKMRAKLSKQPK